MKPMPPPFWQLISQRVYKTDLGEGQPEVVIILMPNQAFKKFSKSKKAAAEYIDGLHFLKAKLNKLVFAAIVPEKNSVSDWLVIITHTTHSTVAIVAEQIPAPAPAPQAKVSMSDLRKPPSKRGK
jgi:hypothetical protein